MLNLTFSLEGQDCDRVLMKDISKKDNLCVKVKAYNLHLLLDCFDRE